MSDWFRICDLGRGVHLVSERLDMIDPGFATGTVNTYLIEGRRRAALFDTGMGIGSMRQAVEQLTSLPVCVINSHSHWDHVGGNCQFDDIAIHPAEAGELPEGADLAGIRAALCRPELVSCLPQGFDPGEFRLRPSQPGRLLRHGELVDLGGRVLRVISTPGHSPGSVSLWDGREGVLLTGDAFYRGTMWLFSPGEADPDQALLSLRRLLVLRPDIRLLCPGHEEVPVDPVHLARAVRHLEGALSTPSSGEPWSMGGKTVARLVRTGEGEDLSFLLPLE